MMSCKYFFTWLTLSSFFSFCNAQTGSYEEKLNSLYKNTVPLIKPQQLAFEYERDSSLYILDTREFNEFQVSHIKGARHVGYNKFKLSSIGDIPKDARVFVYCSVGYRSERIGEKLLKKGYKNVYNLYGGIFEWVNQGYKITDIEGQETKQVHTYSKKWSVWLEKGEKIYD